MGKRLTRGLINAAALPAIFQQRELDRESEQAEEQNDAEHGAPYLDAGEKNNDGAERKGGHTRALFFELGERMAPDGIEEEKEILHQRHQTREAGVEDAQRKKEDERKGARVRIDAIAQRSQPAHRGDETDEADDRDADVEKSSGPVDETGGPQVQANHPVSRAQGLQEAVSRQLAMRSDS